MDFAGKNTVNSDARDLRIRVLIIGLPSAYYYGYYYPQPMVGSGISS